ADVGYALLPQAQGKGYASEALRAVCEYGFTTLGVQAINAWVLENVMEAPIQVLGLSKQEARERAVKYLAKVGIDERQQAKYP
uniref:GNAT family N-acetyltransferase n=1 Tax=Klebsiella pneumoniae TaxID=573 RepID=UPI00214C9935